MYSFDLHSTDINMYIYIQPIDLLQYMKDVCDSLTTCTGPRSAP